MPPPPIDPTERQLARRLLPWFRRHRRDLPWRRRRDPYRVWVSEVMLQQTQVATVTPYYERFVARFPDLASLARADVDDVLKAWEGLGYYRRARGLKRAAELLVAAGDAEVPADYQRLLGLPGVGRYTAGAIMSIAFDRPYPALDGNVRRVLCRLWAVDEPPDSPAMTRWLWDGATALIPEGRAGQFNEALMELGALVCTPRAPGCGRCPLRAQCAAAQLDAPERFPRARPRGPLPHVDVVAAIIQRGRRILIAQRRPEAMLGGLWEFPGGKVERGETLAEALHRELGEELGITVRIEQPYLQVKHAYSHFRITLHTFLCRHSRGRPRPLGCAAWRWVEPAALRSYAFPKADRVVLEALQRRQG